MKSIWFIILGLIPTILVFAFASPWLGLIIGLVMFLIFELVWWLWALSVRSIVSYFSEKFGTSEEELITKITEEDGEFYNKYLRKTVERSLRGGKRK